MAGFFVGTIPGSKVAGRTEGGYAVTADGIDEHGNETTGYVLGRGDVFVLEADSSAFPAQGRWTVRYLEGCPTEPCTGDLYADDGVFRIWNGSAWISSKVPTRTSELVNDSGFLTSHQSLSAYATREEVSEVSSSIRQQLPTRTSQLSNDSGFLTRHQNLDAYCTKTKATQMVQAAEAKIPTRTSQLSNDSSFATDSDLARKRDCDDLAVRKDAPWGIERWVGTVDGMEASFEWTEGSWFADVMYVGYCSIYTDDGVHFTLSNTGGDHAFTGRSLDYTDAWGVRFVLKAEVAVDDRLALVSELPSKTSQLANDARFVSESEIGNGWVYIAQNGQQIGSFTLNQKNGVWIAFDTPTKTSDLVNDSDFTTKGYVDGLMGSLESVIGGI